MYTSEMLLPLSHLDSGREAEDKLHMQHYLEALAEGFHSLRAGLSTVNNTKPLNYHWGC